MEVELKVNKSYDYQKLYKFNFTIYKKNDDNCFLVSDGNIYIYDFLIIYLIVYLYINFFFFFFNCNY